jgi:hypothetical protein
VRSFNSMLRHFFRKSCGVIGGLGMECRAALIE